LRHTYFVDFVGFAAGYGNNNGQ